MNLLEHPAKKTLGTRSPLYQRIFSGIFVCYFASRLFDFAVILIREGAMLRVDCLPCCLGVFFRRDYLHVQDFSSHTFCAEVWAGMLGIRAMAFRMASRRKSFFKYSRNPWSITARAYTIYSRARSDWCSMLYGGRHQSVSRIRVFFPISLYLIVADRNLF